MKRRSILVAACLVSACDRAPAAAVASPDLPAPPPAASVIEEAPHAPRPPRIRIDGRAFPDKVLALTWDDGPDFRTLELATFLHEQHVPATFFVVGQWRPAVSEEPGRGPRKFETGMAALGLPERITALGHRLANHTLNHVLLGDASADVIVEQLEENQLALDPYQRGAVALFRAPGGAWSDASSAAVDGDPDVARLAGPVHWDIDGKDWEGSLYCRSEHPDAECEPAAPGGASRVKPEVIAERYLAIADSIGHGIVLFHDRVGDVGSDYALRVAHHVIPALVARGYVFAAPVLRFSPLAPYDADAIVTTRRTAPPVVADAAALFGEPIDARALVAGDVDGDGAPDLCASTGEGVRCAIAKEGRDAIARTWSTEASFATAVGARAPVLRLGDVNGDGRADLCAATREGLACALSDARAFLASSIWLAPFPDEAAFELVDANGDGRADVCVERARGLRCGLAP